ncbi:nostrin isoform X2 [Callorhinchus milii]|uniref:nostrin isoform X2 n=1 Tax=Callorhinchus milii TaxID=7868 RepID=UPI0004573E0E|nr:nostrin isoform X2 [Callorhinchus milii]|eukprot:gi/632945441/ref/XP_007888066.1/ PREDICTED: nostrin isoform X2 [Callorhinchus milii]
MKDPYGRVYEHIKKFSKNGDNYCKELISVLQQRADLEKRYSKGLIRLASKITKASANMMKNSIFDVWNCVSEEMAATADLHRKLGSAIEQEAIKPIRQVLDEHSKRRKPLDIAVDKASKLVIDNWSQQIKCKKKLMTSTKNHEVLFHFVDGNTQVATEKEKRKLLSKLKKSTEALTKMDNHYYKLNRTGEDTRLKWELTLEQSYQKICELEKEKINLLCDILNKYNHHISCFGRTLIECQRQIHEAVQNVNIEKDILILVEERSILSDENKTEFLLTDYYEEETRNSMDKERRRTGLALKIQRLQEDITRSLKDKEGLEKMVRTYSENPSFSAKLEETVMQLNEITLKLTLLEFNFYKLSLCVAELEGAGQPSHPLNGSITKCKDKEYYHSVVQISRPVKMKNVQHRRSLTNSIASDTRRDHQGQSPQPANQPIRIIQPTNSNHSSLGQEQMRADTASNNSDQLDERDCSTLDGVCPIQEIGTCKVLYTYQAGREDELNIKKGDILRIHRKDITGWWFGSFKGKKGMFPATYVEELSQDTKYGSSEA